MARTNGVPASSPNGRHGRPVCRSCYVHPDVIDAHLDGTLKAGLGRQAGTALTRGRHRLSPQEAAVLAFLERRLARAG